MNENVKKTINELVEKNEVCLFMKGTPEVPQCGFSLAVANALKHLKVNSATFETSACSPQSKPDIIILGFNTIPLKST